MTKINSPAILRKFKEKHGLTQADIAEACGLAPNPQTKVTGKAHHNTVHQWLNGHTVPAMGWGAVNMYLEKYLE